MAAALEKFGRIDVLVNAAGIYGPIGPLVENDLEEWVQAVQINLLGAVYCMHAWLPRMLARGKGVVINFSGGGAVAPFPRFSAYSASKAAVVRLTETVAEEVKDSGVRINAIAPGAVNTRLLDQILAAQDRAGQEFYAKALEQNSWPARSCAARIWSSRRDRKSTRLNSSHGYISYAVFCLKKKNNTP